MFPAVSRWRHTLENLSCDPCCGLSDGEVRVACVVSDRAEMAEKHARLSRDINDPLPLMEYLIGGS